MRILRHRIFVTAYKRLLFIPKTFLLLLLCVFCFTGCKSKQSAEADTASTSGSSNQSSTTDTPKSLTADISGDVSQHFVAVNDEINVAFLPTNTKGEFRFGIDANKESGAQTFELSTGLDGSFHFTPGLDQLPGGARFSIVTDNAKTDYVDMAYAQYFATSDDGKDDAHIVLSKAERLSSKNALLVRYRLVGTFRFKGANTPEPIDEACAKEAGMYAGQHGKRNPPFRADLCKAKQIQVNGSFDIVQDFLASAF
jgi:hypothetical protein